MILSDKMIKEAMKTGDIVIEPFDPAALGSNSYDVHLGNVIKTYATGYANINDGRALMPSGHVAIVPQPLDCKVEHEIHEYIIGTDGLLLIPGTLYLGATLEYTESHRHVPFLDGKSSIGRLGITIHCTAGRGDVGFCNHWTLEIHVIQPVRVYPGMPIGQLIYFETGAVDMPYDKKENAKYNGRDPKPQASRMWKNFK